MTLRTEQAYLVSCPKCKQTKGNHCVYVMPPSYDPTAPWWSYTSNQRDQIQKAGQETKVPHQERYHHYDHTVGRRFQRMIYENAHPVHRASDEIRAAHKAMVSWDQTEYDRLRVWFARYGQILVR